MTTKNRLPSEVVDVVSVEVLHDHVARPGFSDRCIADIDREPPLAARLLGQLDVSHFVIQLQRGSGNLRSTRRRS